VSGRAVYINSDNKIGTLVSTHRFKDEIKPMDKASEAILATQASNVPLQDGRQGLSRNLV